MMPRDKYAVPVNAVPVEELPKLMNQAFEAVRPILPPHTGILIIAFDFGEGGGLGYISNGDRAGCIKMLEEWIAHQRSLT